MDFVITCWRLIAATLSEGDIMSYKGYWKPTNINKWRFLKEFETLKSAVECMDYLANNLPNGSQIKFKVTGEFNGLEFLKDKVA